MNTCNNSNFIFLIGVWRDRMWPDGWTAVTADGKRSAQFEHTLLVSAFLFSESYYSSLAILFIFSCRFKQSLDELKGDK